MFFTMLIWIIINFQLYFWEKSNQWSERFSILITTQVSEEKCIIWWQTPISTSQLQASSCWMCWPCWSNIMKWQMYKFKYLRVNCLCLTFNLFYKEFHTCAGNYKLHIHHDFCHRSYSQALRVRCWKILFSRVYLHVYKP